MQHAAVLHVRARPYPDGLRVAAQYRPVPHAHLLTQGYLAYYEGAGGHKGGGGDFGVGVAEGDNGPAVVGLAHSQRRTRRL